LHGVVASGDKAAAALVTSDEYGALFSVPYDYNEGRRVLVGLGILPPVGEAPPFQQISEIEGILTSKLQEILCDKANCSEADSRLAGLSKDRKFAILLTLAFLRIELARGMLSQIYGGEAAYDVVTILSDPGVVGEWARFSKVAKVLKTMAPGTPVDFVLLDAVMSSGGVESKSEEEFNNNREFYDMAVRWLNEERVGFCDFLRNMLQNRSNIQRATSLAGCEREDWIGPCD
jgi:hypothetical protein